jgi:LPXTG-site transpeptidase (sortase) family protein
LRDLFVFLFLFLLGLAVWTTGLYPAGPAQATTPIRDETGQRLAVVARTDARSSLKPEGEIRPQVDSLEDTNASNAHVEVSSSRLLSSRSSASTGTSGTKAQSRNEMVIQRISIPSLKIDAQVVDVPFNGMTWDISTLGQDIARLGQIPGESAGKNTVLAGHFTIGYNEMGPFRYISRLATGEPILVYTDRMIYTYQVREHALVGDRDENVYAHTSEPQLTLLTCETWDEKTGKFLRRRVVYADLIRSEPLGNPTIQ